MFRENTVETQSMTCGNCGKEISWRSDDDNDPFNGVMSKFINHINHDKECLRIKKLSIINDTNKKLAQDYWYKWHVLNL